MSYPNFNLKPLVKSVVQAASIHCLNSEAGHWFIDFGKVAFGTIRFRATIPHDSATLRVHLGEVTREGEAAIDRNPTGTKRYRMMSQQLIKGTHGYEVEITADERNTLPHAIRMPETIGEVMPFRYCELEGYPGDLAVEDIQQIFVHYPFDDDAAIFTSSDPVLNDIWEFSKYSIKATSFTGLYIDGDRERIPYEGDAYINQIAHYCLDTEYGMARATLEHFIQHPTWPIEWNYSIPMMVWEEYLYTGNSDFIAANYDIILERLLIRECREDGLLTVDEKTFKVSLDRQNGEPYLLAVLVDWPRCERDDHEITAVDSVVNAYFYRALVLMERLAVVCGKQDDADRFSELAQKVYTAYQKVFFDAAKGFYRDGEGVAHSSIHANLFPLAFGLVPNELKNQLVQFIQSRGMACSVYAAQHLLDGLYRAGASDYAFQLLTSCEERSWSHMVHDLGATISLEAWDDRFKPNQDWNHAWGAAPASLIPRRLMGIRPTEPGFKRVEIRPQLGGLTQAFIRYPSPLGPIEVGVEKIKNTREYTLKLPEGISADFIFDDGAKLYFEYGEHRFEK